MICFLKFQWLDPVMGFMGNPYVHLLMCMKTMHLDTAYDGDTCKLTTNLTTIGMYLVTNNKYKNLTNSVKL